MAAESQVCFNLSIWLHHWKITIFEEFHSNANLNIGGPTVTML
jgi:hypothetical protein